MSSLFFFISIDYDFWGLCIIMNYHIHIKVLYQRRKLINFPYEIIQFYPFIHLKFNRLFVASSNRTWCRRKKIHQVPVVCHCWWDSNENFVFKLVSCCVWLENNFFRTCCRRKKIHKVPILCHCHWQNSNDKCVLRTVWCCVWLKYNFIRIPPMIFESM